MREYEGAQDKDRVEKLEQSKKEKNWNYDISDPDRVNYETVSTEHNAEAKAKNDERATLIAAVDKAKTKEETKNTEISTQENKLKSVEKLKEQIKN